MKSGRVSSGGPTNKPSTRVGSEHAQKLRARRAQKMRARRNQPIVGTRTAKPRADSIPMSAVSPLLEEWLARNGVESRGVTECARMLGFTPRRIFAIRRGYDTDGVDGVEVRKEHLSFAAADDLLCAMGMIHEWHISLADYYEFDERGPVAAAGSPSSRAANDGSRATETSERKAA